MLRQLRLLLAAAALLAGAPAAALKSHIRLEDLNHASWSEKDGVPGNIHCMAQTPDGWLWLGTPDGLYRFDGVRFERYLLPATSALNRHRVANLYAGANGQLLIAFALGGLSILAPDGKVTDISVRDGDQIGEIGAMTMDSDGSIWASGMNGVYHYANGRWSTALRGDDWVRDAARSMLLDQYGRLWVANSKALYLYDRAAGRLRRHGGPELRGSLSQSPDGRLWIGMPDSIREVPTPPVPKALPRAPGFNHAEGRWAAQFDRDGNLWAIRCPYGVCRVPNADKLPGPVIVPSRQSDDKLDQHWQLSSLSTQSVLEDREGNIWIASHAGLDRFRENKLVPARIPGASNIFSMAGDRQGRLLAADPTDGTLWTLSIDGPPTPDRSRFAAVVSNDRDGNLLVAGKRDIERHRQDGVERIALPPDAHGKPADLTVVGLLDDGKVLWMASYETGLMGWMDGRWLPRKAFNLPPRILMSANGGQGRLWLSHGDGTLSHYDNGKISRYDISMVGLESGIFAGPELTVSGEQGLAVLQGGRFVALAAAKPEVLLNVTGMAVTPDGDRWLNGSKGIVHVTRADWEAALRQPAQPLRYELINVLDGYPGRAALDNRLPTVYNAGNGRLWLRATGGIVRLETGQLAPNTVQPMVQVLNVNTPQAGYRAHGPVRLPPGAHSFNIAYTAPGLRKPEGMHFRYQLIGVDNGWQEAGPQRAAYYTNIGPGNYQFQVRAVNEDGVESAIATLALDIEPTVVQTWWFRTLCGLALAVLLYALYRYRVSIVTARVAQQLQVRMDERERIARTLHDTILQSVQAIVLRLHSLARELPAEGNARSKLERLLDSVDTTVAEGRNQVHELRGGAPIGPEQAIRDTGELLAELYPGTAFSLQVSGTPRPLADAAAEDICAIAREAMRNGFRHAAAGKLVVEVDYAAELLQLRVTDDGKGIAAATLQAGHKPGHWGLSGMNERAARLDAQLEVDSKEGAGTRVTLSVPAAMAYSPAQPDRLR